MYTFASVNGVIYVIVGILMLVAGIVIMRRKTIFHLELPFIKAHHINNHQGNEDWLQDPKPWMPAVHGFIAGWGFGAFAIIIYTVLAPSTHSVIWGWVPGAIFGIGTMIMQALAGAVFGLIASKRGLSSEAIRKVALKTASNTLTYGGIAFIFAGALSQLFPDLSSFSLNTGLHIHNLDNLGLAFILVIICVLGVGLTTMIRQTHAELVKVRADGR